MDKEAIREELNKVREQIRSMKSDFSKKKNEKEAHFQKGEEYSIQINSLYEEVKEIENNSGLEKINKDLDERKVEYDEIKKKYDELNAKFSEVKSSSRPVRKPEIKTVSADKAKKEISKLDLKLQTQVLSLEKEGELIRKIEELKEIAGTATGLSSDSDYDSSDEFKQVKKELNSIKRKYFNIEKKIRSLYKQIRLISKEKKKKYKEIDSLRDLKKQSFETFRTQKKDYSKVGGHLRELFKKEDDLLTELGESPVQSKKSNDKNIRVKQKEAEDKLMKKGGVLTTEDLMLFQKK